MKISELLKRLEEIRLEYGNLEVWLEVQPQNVTEDPLAGELADMYTEERTTLYLVAEE